MKGENKSHGAVSPRDDPAQGENEESAEFPVILSRRARQDENQQIKGNPVNQTGKASISSIDKKDNASMDDVQDETGTDSTASPLIARARRKHSDLVPPSRQDTKTTGLVQPFPLHTPFQSPKPSLADQIGKSLRMVYDDVLAQPVPDRFLDLLKELESKAPVPSATKKEEP